MNSQLLAIFCEAQAQMARLEAMKAENDPDSKLKSNGPSEFYYVEQHLMTLAEHARNSND